MQQINPDVKQAKTDLDNISEMLKEGKKIDDKTIADFKKDLAKLLGNSTVPESVKKDLIAAMATLKQGDSIDLSSMFRIGLDLSKIETSEGGWPPDVSDAMGKLKDLMGKAPNFDISDYIAAKKELQEALNNPLLTDEQKEKINTALGKLDQVNLDKEPINITKNFQSVQEALAALTE